jgi:acyl carrier protein
MTAVPMTTDAVVDVFRRVLEDPAADAATDFFDVGGDSLLATRVLAAAARATGVELTMEDFLTAPTPALLAERLAAGMPGAVAR